MHVTSDDSFGAAADRYWLRDATADDLVDVHAVFASNPEFLALRKDIAAQGGYDLASVTRWWEAAALDPQRHLRVVTAESTGVIVGLVDYVDESPADGMPWIGLILVESRHQRHGVGTAALRTTLEELASRGHRTVRAAVMAANETGLGFARHAGFTVIGSSTALAGTAQHVILLERSE